VAKSFKTIMNLKVIMKIKENIKENQTIKTGYRTKITAKEIFRLKRHSWVPKGKWSENPA
jgi:hypothetical protein